MLYNFRYKLLMANTLSEAFENIGGYEGYADDIAENHCEFVTDTPFPITAKLNYPRDTPVGLFGKYFLDYLTGNAKLYSIMKL